MDASSGEIFPNALRDLDKELILYLKQEVIKSNIFSKVVSGRGYKF